MKNSIGPVRCGFSFIPPFSGHDPHQQSRSSSVVSNLINNNSNAAVIGGTAAATTAAGQLQQQQQNPSSQLQPLSDVTNLNFIHHHNNLNNQVYNTILWGFFCHPKTHIWLSKSPTPNL